MILDGTLLAAWTDYLFFGFRIIAGIVGAFLGWLFAPMLARFLYRLAFQQPLPGWLKFVSRLIGAGVVGFLVFWFIPLGGGGGLGWGPGDGGGPGRGPGEGGSSLDSGKGKDGKEKTGTGKDGTGTGTEKKVEPVPTPRTPIEVELIAAKDYPGGKKYYLLERQPPPMTLEELEERLRPRFMEIEVHVVVTGDTGGLALTKGNPLDLLLGLTGRHGIPAVLPKELSRKTAP